VVVATIAIVIINKLHGGCICREEIAGGQVEAGKLAGVAMTALLLKTVAVKQSIKGCNRFIPIRAIGRAPTG
jgi:hypothetical protein